jgi:hypothetical protein
MAKFAGNATPTQNGTRKAKGFRRALLASQPRPNCEYKGSEAD